MRIAMHHSNVVLAIAAAVVTCSSHAFVPSTGRSITKRTRLQASASEEAAKLLERARAMRAEIATLEGRSVDEVEAEAQQVREEKRQRQEQAAQAAAERRRAKNAKQQSAPRQSGMDAPPDTFDEQIWQAKAAVERAYRDGLTRQTIRFALLRPDDKGLFQDQEREWPGGAQQMYRESAGPLARELLQQLRVDSSQAETADQGFTSQPTVQSQDIWDFDGSALITAEAAAGPSGDVQALVQPNTDVKYVNDIDEISQSLGPDRLFLLVNPFWRNVDSWGFNLLAPQAKSRAQSVIFDTELATETFCVLQKTVRGEDCVAVKAYPYDWQLYALAEGDGYYNGPTWVRLGSTESEPKASEFDKRLNERPEFQMSKNMRQMQRLFGDKDD